MDDDSVAELVKLFVDARDIERLNNIVESSWWTIFFFKLSVFSPIKKQKISLLGLSLVVNNSSISFSRVGLANNNSFSASCFGPRLVCGDWMGGIHRN